MAHLGVALLLTLCPLAILTILGSGTFRDRVHFVQSIMIISLCLAAMRQRVVVQPVSPRVVNSGMPRGQTPQVGRTPAPSGGGPMMHPGPMATPLRYSELLHLV